MVRISTFNACLALVGAALPACGSSSDPTPAELEAGSTLTVASSDGTATGHVRVDGSAIVEGPNSFLVDFDPSQTELVAASALMPVHGHGTPAPPTVSSLSPGYRIDRMMLNMSGIWDVFLDVRVEGKTSRIEFTVDVP